MNVFANYTYALSPGEFVAIVAFILLLFVRSVIADIRRTSATTRDQPARETPRLPVDHLAEQIASKLIVALPEELGNCRGTELAGEISVILHQLLGGFFIQTLLGERIKTECLNCRALCKTLPSP